MGRLTLVPKTWYAASLPASSAFSGELLTQSQTCDVCIIGGGFSGISAALELARAGKSVVVLEAKRIGHGASGLNGGQIDDGFSKSTATVINEHGLEKARRLCELTLDGITLIKNRIIEHGIDCDLRQGVLVAALHPKHMQGVIEEQKAWQSMGHNRRRVLDAAEIRHYIGSEAYCGGMFKPDSAHFHPLKYLHGLAKAAQKSGAKIFENSPVTDVVQKNGIVSIKCNGVTVTAKQAIIACDTSPLPFAKALTSKTVCATSYAIVTEPLPQDIAKQILPTDAAVYDCSNIMNYYRLTEDRRLLFGGRYKAFKADLDHEKTILNKKMLDVFPRLEGTKIDYCWNGAIGATFDRLPDIGKIGDAVYYMQGYSGHGVALSNISGKAVADAILGNPEKFNIFASVRHMSNPFGIWMGKAAVAIRIAMMTLDDMWGQKST